MSKKVTFDKTIRNYDNADSAHDYYWNDKPYVDGKMLRHHYEVRFQGSVEVTDTYDSKDRAKTIINCKISVKNTYTGWGAYFTKNADIANFFKLYIGSTDDGDEIIDGTLISSTVDITDTSWKVLKNISNKTVYLSEGGQLYIELALKQSGAGRAGKNSVLKWNGSYISNYKKASGSAGFSARYRLDGIIVPDPYTPSKVTITEVSDEIGGGSDGKNKFAIKYTLTPSDRIKKLVMNIYDDDGSTDFIGEATKYYENLNESAVKFPITSKTNKKVMMRYGLFSGLSLKNSHRYKVELEVTDKPNSDTEEYIYSSKKSVYTFREPTLTKILAYKYNSTTSVGNPAKINARTGIKFVYDGANDCRWETHGEPKFRSLIKSPISNQILTQNTWTDMGTNTWLHWDAAGTRKLFPFNGSSNRIVTMSFLRRNGGASWDTGTKTIDVQVFYVPEQSVSNVLYKKNSSSGAAMNYDTQAKRTITNITGYTGIYTYWTYDDTTPESGYIQGYRIQLQYYNGEWKSYKTYYTSNKNYTIPIGDVPRMFSSRLVITPYYANGQSKIADASVASNYKYASNTYQTIVNFFTVTSGIVKPTISLPKTNTTWFNKDFRVCFVLPVDNDMAWLQANEPSIANNYKYGDIEVYIDDGTVRKYLISNSTQADIYSISASNMLYQRPVVVWPNKSETNTKGSYTVKIKVKKNLAYTNNQEIWSAYSDAITINVSHPTYNPQQNYPVLASHYNTMADMVNKARNVYGITSINPISNVTAGTTVISALQYKYNVSVTMANLIKGTVNDYGGAYSKGSITTAYDRSVIKFDTGNKIKNSASSFNPKGKADNVKTFITANIDSSSATASGDYSSTRTGANYIKWIYEQFDYLK